LKVVSVLPGSTAGVAGLFPGDLVTDIDGHAVEGLTLVEAAIALDGEAGTSATLDIIRDGEPGSIIIDRQQIAYDTVRSEITQPGVGYLRLLEFGPDSPYEFHFQLQALLDGGANTIVLDLRDNPGGLLTSVVIIGSEFLTGGLVMKTAGAEEVLDFPVLEGGIATGEVRVVVLINGGSASAAEVLAAVLQERGRASVVGEPSFGKNTVQQPFDLRNGGVLRVTVARWTTPSGTSVELRGVLPDVAVNLSTSLNAGEVVDTALAAAG
jgi:carboxyl-terminal processing protease